MQALFIVVFFIWGGTSDKLDDVHLPDVELELRRQGHADGGRDVTVDNGTSRLTNAD